MAAAPQHTTQSAIPRPWRWQVPHDWRAIDLLSDLHLSPALPRTFDAFERHLAHTQADAVLVLGDLFEVWVGDDQARLPFERRCLEALARAAKRCWVGLMVGNRDFLLGPKALEAASAHPLPDPTLLTAFGQAWLLSHGDALCLDDTDYQAFRAQVRSSSWQQTFLARSYAERATVAGQIRAESRARKSASAGPQGWADVDHGAARAWLQSVGASVLVHGHTHRPGPGHLGEGCTREVLSDWDLDGPQPRAEIVRLSARGLERLPPCTSGLAVRA